MPRPQGHKGVTLIETLIALGILGLVGTAFMAALVTGGRATRLLDDQVQAEALARSQLEDIKNTAYNRSLGCYPNCYPVTVTVPPQYSIATKTDPLAGSICDGTQFNCIQKITVTVKKADLTVLTLVTYKKCPYTSPTSCAIA